MTTIWPENLTSSDDAKGGFAWFPSSFDGLYENLEKMAEDEDWGYHFTSTTFKRPVLFNYIKYTYKRLAEERKIALSEDGRFACFNTGLVTEHQEPIYASFEANRSPDLEPWVFKDWIRQGDYRLNVFPELPGIAHYFDDPTCLVFDARKDLRVNVEHIIEGTPRSRFPDPYKLQDNFALQNVIRGAIEGARQRVQRSYKTAIPHFYLGQVQLLLPLCLSNPKRADLALVIEKHETFYRATTCLTLDMAYTDARLLTKPDRDWLQP